MALPSFAPLHEIGTVEILTVKRAGSVMVTESSAVQLLSSVTVTTYVPMDKLTAVLFACEGIEFH